MAVDSEMDSYLTKWLPVSLLISMVILTEGFSSIAIEILSIRQLLPFVGGSVTVTSLVIGIFLLFLALGYEYGGRVKGNLTVVLRRNFLLAAIWVGTGLSYLFMEVFFYYIQKLSGHNVMLPLMAWLLFILAPAVFWLGQTLPVTINMLRQDSSAGAVAGKTMAVSTAGSFLGALLSTLVLMYFLGIAWTLMVVFILLSLPVLMMGKNRQELLAYSAIIVFFAAVVYFINICYEKYRFVLTTANANYEILSAKNSTLKPGERILVVNNSGSSFINSAGKGFGYIQMIQKILEEDLGLRAGEILVLGAGGFTLSGMNSLHNHFLYVDIDSKIKKAVEPGFVLKTAGDFVADDARHFLLSTDRKFDAIVTDVYSRRTEVPASLTTLEFMHLIRSHLKPDGHAIFNVIANPFFGDRWSARINRTIQTGFDACIVWPVRYSEKPTNMIYACSNHALSPRSFRQPVYTDNFNHAGFDQQ